MHELTLAESALAIIEDAAEREAFTRVQRVWLEVGALSHVQPDALRAAFGAVTAGSCADGAELEIVPVAGQGWCGSCVVTVPMTVQPQLCPYCECTSLQVTGGTRMRVRDLDVR